MANGNGIPIRTFLAAVSVFVIIIVALGGYIVGGASASGQIRKCEERATELEKQYAVVLEKLTHIEATVDEIKKELRGK